MKPLSIAVLGATGSIGRQTLDVVRMHPDQVTIVALAAGRQVEPCVQAALEFGVTHLAFGDSSVRDATALTQLPDTVDIGFGPDAVTALTQLEEVDLVLNALSGAAGLRASYDTVAAGKKLALANKESLVVGGDLIMPLATRETLLPVDSEHSAIFQCLIGEDAAALRSIWLTASGGPFLGKTREELHEVTPQQALAHPTWSMGPKVTVDSATLMNKGLEVLEASHLFGADIDDVHVVIHPQSCVHSLVAFTDGSVKAQLAVPDMRLPIQFALSYPGRWDTTLDMLDIANLGSLEFAEPDCDTFRCLPLAMQAGHAGGTAPCVMNAADEVAVAAFLAGDCSLTDIDACVEDALGAFNAEPVSSIEQLEGIDARARAHAQDFLDGRR
ncbi:MAG: 1-deoxy-D-xylulose-5-phosphate reductoisomerase [Coriobacteriaceae bacterium]|nr:1-deoxy-D-xylulose-5-phosphate reductoisomerase [Coriobacteriaceae bacterium]